MITKWYSRRDPITTVPYHELEDEKANVLATIKKGGKKGFLVHVPPSIPFSRASLHSAKADAEWILLQRK
jgi:hypothetical protein